MKGRKAACGWLAIAVTLGLAGAAARAADEPLLVVVEAPPALEIDAAEVRRAVGSELHVRTLAPIKASQAPPPRALIVALGQNRIDSIDVLLQFAVHFTVSHDETWFGASMIGLRYKLP